jgi:hypothetical protein
MPSETTQSMPKSSNHKRKQVKRDESTEEKAKKKSFPEPRKVDDEPLIQQEYSIKQTQASIENIKVEVDSKPAHDNTASQQHNDSKASDKDDAEKKAIQEGLNSGPVYWLFMVLNYWQLIVGLILGIMIGRLF